MELEVPPPEPGVGIGMGSPLIIKGEPDEAKSSSYTEDFLDKSVADDDPAAETGTLSAEKLCEIGTGLNGPNWGGGAEPDGRDGSTEADRP